MCGLTGIFSSKPSDNLFNLLSHMNANLAHRGPDDEGIWIDQNIGFGHRRLSVMDLSESGKQPMRSQCDRYVIIFNGEIYNHIELRRDLEKEGFKTKWKGHSDTETILSAISNWGIENTLIRLHGMFAIAIWDKLNKRLNLARDRMGEKPLYWGWAGKDFVFSSELKALREHPQFISKINKNALNEYFRLSYIPSPLSIYEGIYKLEPGTVLTVENCPPITPPKKIIFPGDRYESISIKRYWDLNNEIQTNENAIQDEKQAKDLLEKLLSDAVKRQMLSDVPIGAFLSGGIDSSIIAALMQSHSSKPINTFTIGFSEATHDESVHAASVASHLGTQHTKLNVSDSDARDVIPYLPTMYDEPFADSSQIPTHLVCRAASNHVKVALSGDGGDELFGGYNRYIYGPSLYQKLRTLPSPIKKLLNLCVQKIPEKRWDNFGDIYNIFIGKKKGISNLGLKIHRLSEQFNNTKSFKDFHKSLVSVWPEPEDLLSYQMNKSQSVFDNKLLELSTNNYETQMMLRDMLTYLPDDILCKVDRAAMSVSLETRAPFLDPSIITFSNRLPSNMKIKDGHGKWLLRQVLYKYVPNKIIDRPKTGFALPIGNWLRGPLRDWAEENLSKKKLSDSGLINPDLVNKIWKQHLSGKIDTSSKLWSILMFQSWYYSIS